MEERSGKNQLVVNVRLFDVIEKEGWPNIAAYVYSRSGDLLGMGEVKQDSKKPETWKAKLEIKSKRETLLVKIGPLLENERLLERYQPVTKKVQVKDAIDLTFTIERKFWICWLKLPYYVTGTVKKQKVGPDVSICAGDVTIYDVDIRYCLLRLPDTVIERVREAIIDAVIDSPPIDPAIVEFQKPQMWWDWDDDDWCGTKPRPPFPPPRIDVLRKLDSLPQQWAFAKNR